MLPALKRCFSTLILISFTFQTLLHSFAWAMDELETLKKSTLTETQSQISESRANALTTDTLNPSFRSRKSSDPEDLRHKKLFQPLIDTLSESLDNESSDSYSVLPSLQTLSSNPDEFAEFEQTYPLYEDLEVTESFLCWKSFGYDFRLHREGHLFLERDPRAPCFPCFEVV